MKDLENAKRRFCAAFISPLRMNKEKSGFSDILYKVIEECTFVHMFDIDYTVPPNSCINDISQFFDFLIYNISKLDRMVESMFEQVSASLSHSISRADILAALSLCKRISLPKSAVVESLYTSLYQKHALILDSIFSSCLEKERCLFFIFSPVFPKEILVLLSYKSAWISALQTVGSFASFSELDMIIFLSGYVYLFKTKNPFGDRLDENLDDKRIYILYYA